MLNLLRRWLYGGLLALGAPLALAQPPRAVDHVPAATPEDATRENFSALVFIQGLAEDQAQPAVFGTSFSRAALGERPELGLSTAPLPARTGLLTLSFSDDELRRWRRGAGLDISVPDVGQFRLNFFSRGGEALKRWTLSPAPDEGRDASHRHWSVGASIDWTRSEDGEKRGLVFVPKFAVNVASLLRTQQQFDLCIQYAQWRSRESSAGPRVPQATLRWSF